MNKRKLLSTRVALLSVLLLSGHTVAYGQKAPNRQNPLLPDVHLGLNKLGVDAILTPPAALTAVLPVLPSLSVPGVAVRVALPIIPAPLGTNVNVNIDGSGPVLEARVEAADGRIPGEPPVPNFPAPGPTPAAQDQLLQQRLALLPTCR